jgi:D-alanyl-D-alanine carboxypeptidase (penicillin-binding protein 5/6)
MGTEESRLKQISAEDKVNTSDAPTAAGENNASEKVPTGSVKASDTITIEEATAGFATDISSDGSLTASAAASAMPQLIYDSSEADYLSYIPELQTDDELNEALDIDNPDISIDAEAAILFDAATKQVLYYKNPVKAAFPASTLKLLTAIVVLNWCTVDEEVTIGDEIKLIASDSTRAYLVQGEVLTIRDLLEAMLLPSGNDAAYAVAAYVGRKSLSNPLASREEAVTEFIRLMNERAKELGVKNSCFKTPDGYDAIGQYTTAYDMGLIGMAAAGYDTIVEIARHSRISTTFISGEEVTWKNTNKLISRYSGEYYSHAIGLKTGTSTMAGRCIVAAAKSEDRKVVCVILDSTIAGRWEDAIRLLKYGLE